MQININSPVECVDGDVGRISGLVIERESLRLVDLVVKTGGIASQDIVVPMEVVRAAEPDQIYLRLTSQELREEYHKLTEREYVPIGEDWDIPSPDSPQELVVTSIPAIGSEPPLVPDQSDLEHPFLLRELVNVPANAVEVNKLTQVLCPEGPVGALEGILFNPTTNKATHFVTRVHHAPGLLVAIPDYLVGGFEEDAIRVKARKAYIESLPASPQVGIS